MIKRLVIDLDNTIILWKDEYTSALKKVMQEYNLDIDYNSRNTNPYVTLKTNVINGLNILYNIILFIT